VKRCLIKQLFTKKGEKKMIYIKVKGKYKTVKDIAAEYNVSPRLIYARYMRGIKEIEKLVQPKYESVRK
jgi:uncharacterized protein (DUF111 family)